MAMQALVLDPVSETASVQSRPLPSPDPGEIFVKVHAIALNPVDALYVFNSVGAIDRIVGSDFAGTVVTSPPGPNGQQLELGTRVAGFLQGACSVNKRSGVFGQCLVWSVQSTWSSAYRIRWLWKRRRL